MKTAIILFVLSISFLPLAISGLPPLIRLPTKPDFTAYSAILDIDGNPVVPGAKYYAIPAPIGVAGGISVANLNTGNPSSCPTDVLINLTVAGYQPPAVGRPITFYPLKLEDSPLQEKSNLPTEITEIHSARGNDAAAIRGQFPLNVAFDSSDPSDPCAKETVWKLHEKENMIVTGGVIGNEDDIDNWFRIQKNNGRGYIFTWWPSLCLYCRIGYFRIGTVGDGYQLGLNEEFPYPFEFVKAE